MAGGGAGAGAGKPGGTLRIGMAAPNTTLDPHFQSNAPNNAVASHIFDALITNDARSSPAPASRGPGRCWTTRIGNSSCGRRGSATAPTSPPRT
ncbi:hypothetical protein ACFQU7_18950 [Pseudoroseomonas wenyumeiae]